MQGWCKEFGARLLTDEEVQIQSLGGLDVFGSEEFKKRLREQKSASAGGK